MYIFSQDEDLTKCEIINIDNEETLRISNDNFTKIAVKQKLPIKYVVLKESEKGELAINGKNYRMKQAEYVYFETHVANSQNTLKADSNIKNLINTFGNKKSKEIFKNMENNQGERRQTRQIFTYEEQILPKFNDTEVINEIYRLDDIFGTEIIEEFQQVEYDDVDLHESLRKYYEKDKVVILLLDCLIKALERKRVSLKYIDEIFISGCSNFSNFIEPHLFKGYFTDLGKDKMVTIAYILFLMLNDYNVLADELPKFNYDHARLFQILKSIGCTYNKKTMKYKLVKAPKATVVQKKGGGGLRR